MRPARNNKPVFSLSSIIVRFLVIALVVSLLIYLVQPTQTALNPSNSSSSSLGTWKVVISSSSSSSSNNYSVAMTNSSEEEWPPAEAPLFSFSNTLLRVAAPAPRSEDDGVQEETKIMEEEEEKGDGSSKRKISTPLDKVEASLGRARSSIREAAKVRNLTSTHQDPDYVPRGHIYWNANSFHRSYLEMEKVFKIYVYEGDVPLFHEGPGRSIYSSEGRFIHDLEKGHSYRTKDPDEALVYFLPFSVVNLVHYIYLPQSRDREGIKLAVMDYIKVIANKHPFWNRSLGADHFMLSCHDWGPFTTSSVPDLFRKSIRVLCNANTSEGFNPSKDASFPEINLKTTEMPRIGGQPPSTRSTLAFFAGRLHGNIRSLLLNQWKGKDNDVQVYEQLPRRVSYEQMLKKSKFCLCPSGYEVASPRVVEAIYAECVLVLISDGYIPPFSDVLNWKSFSVKVEVKNIPDIKNILMGISSTRYLRMQRRVKQVQRHFLVNGPPKRYDVFHMTVHSIWLRRLNIRIQEDKFT